MQIVRKISLIAVPALAAGLTFTASTESHASTGSRSICKATVGHGARKTCISLFSGKSAFRLPSGSSRQKWGGLARGGKYFVAADGAKIKLNPTTARAAGTNTAYATTIYKATIGHGQVTKLTPVVRVSENAVLQREFAGRTLVGAISQFLPDGTYSLDPDLPVVVKLDNRPHGGRLRGTIINAKTAVTVNHRKYTALSRGKHNPLRGVFTSRLTLTRSPSMHVPFDDELVWSWSNSSSGMGSEFYPSIATLMGHDNLGKTYNVSQHGTPNSGPSLRLQFTAKH